MVAETIRYDNQLLCQTSKAACNVPEAREDFSATESKASRKPPASPGGAATPICAVQKEKDLLLITLIITPSMVQPDGEYVTLMSTQVQFCPFQTGQLDMLS